MSEDEGWEKAFADALGVVARGDFDEIKCSLESLGFKFWEAKDAGHWLYVHPLLRSDPIFRSPRHLYRPHGRKRDCDRVARIDQRQSKQVIEALRAVVLAGQEKEGGNQ